MARAAPLARQVRGPFEPFDILDGVSHAPGPNYQPNAWFVPGPASPFVAADFSGPTQCCASLALSMLGRTFSARNGLEISWSALVKNGYLFSALLGGGYAGILRGMAADKAIREFYRENPRMVSSPFGGVEGIHGELMGSVTESLRVPLAGSALDVGCGRGFLIEWLRERGVDAVGADFVISRGGFPVAQADAAALPFPEQSFDLVCCVDASEHFPEPGRAAAEFYRVLKPGGSYFLSAPNYGNVAGMVKWWCERFGAYERNTWAPFWALAGAGVGAAVDGENRETVVFGRWIRGHPMHRLWRGGGAGIVSVGGPSEDAGAVSVSITRLVRGGGTFDRRGVAVVKPAFVLAPAKTPVILCEIMEVRAWVSAV